MNTLGTKQPYDEYYITFNFINLVQKNSIQSAIVTAVDSVLSDVTNTLTDVAKQIITGAKVKVWICNGETGKTYTITCQIVTENIAEKYELEASLTVTEI